MFLVLILIVVVEEGMFGVDARGVVNGCLIGIGGGADGFVAGVLAIGIAAVQGNETNNQPATGLADKHLGGLQHRLLEGLPFPWIRIIAVSDTLIVL